MINFIKKGCSNFIYFLKKIFKKNNLMLDKAKEKAEFKKEVCNTKSSKSSIDLIKAQNRRNIVTQEIIDIVDKNPTALKNLNIDQLEFINNYYKEDIKKLEMTIETLENDVKEIETLIDYYKSKTA